MGETLERNDPCHCGSGRKYKNCCFDKDQSKSMSKLGVLALAIVILLGLWLVGTSLSGGAGADCPAGTTWSAEHNHCH